MASILSKILAFGLHRMNLFSETEADHLAARQRMEQFTRRMGPSRHVRVTPVQAGGVPAEWLAREGMPENRALLYIHGGAWYMGSTNTHRALVADLATAAGIRALSINYRLAPEHPFPAALEDCRAAYRWLQDQGIPAGNLAVAGDSAGGNLTLALLVALRDAGEPLPAGAVALSPATDLTMSGESHRTRKSLDPLFWKADAHKIVESYLAAHDPRDPLISPLFADLHGLPPVLIHVGDHEVLLDDSLRFVVKAREAGVDARIKVWQEMFHVFQAMGMLMPEARRSIEEIGAFIREVMESAANRDRA